MYLRYYLISLVCAALILPFWLTGQNVGIGTTNPSDRLHVVSGSGSNALRVQIDGSTKFRVLGNGGTTIGINNTNGTPANGLYVSGNTGLGVSSPNDKLAVAGNIDMTGEIKTNGQSGSEGQLLASNGSGGMEWIDLESFENFDDFFNPDATFTWEVPAGVSVVLFELWGAGGGGGPAGGGGGGAYARVRLNVTPGSLYSIDVGEGGLGYNGLTETPATSGEATTISGPGTGSVLSAGGGTAASAVATGLGGTASISAGLQSERYRGGHGSSNQVNYTEYASGSFAQIIHYGKGGDAANSQPTGGTGAVLVQNTTTEANVYQVFGRPGSTPGGGGGGGEPTGSIAGGGADGYVIIRW